MHTKQAASTLLALLAVACAAVPTRPAVPTLAAPTVPDRELQATVDAELDELARASTTHEAVVVAMDPRTGVVLAMGGRAKGASAPELPLARVYPSGSVAKVFTVAAALEAGVVRPSDRLSGADVVVGSSTVHGDAARPTLSVEDVLVFSSNVGAARVYEKLGKARLHDALVGFGFGQRPPVDGAGNADLGEAASWSDELATKIAYGAGLRATPLQYAAAFAAVAAGGEWRAPTRDASRVAPGRRVMSPEHAAELLRMMEGVVHRDDGTGTGARVAGVRATGKTGTATFDDDDTTFAAFVGAVPANAPRLVVYVGVKTSARGYTGGSVAAPAFARIVTRARGPWQHAETPR